MIADAPAPTVSAPARKHQNYDRELSDRERKLVDAWHDPKKRRAELTSLVWQRDALFLSVYCGGIGTLIVSVMLAVSIVQGLMGDTSETVLEVTRLLFWAIIGTSLVWQCGWFLPRPIAALKYIGQLEDRLANAEPPSHE